MPMFFSYLYMSVKECQLSKGAGFEWPTATCCFHGPLPYWSVCQTVPQTVEKQIIETKVILCSCLLEIRIQYDKNNIIHPEA